MDKKAQVEQITTPWQTSFLILVKVLPDDIKAK